MRTFTIRRFDPTAAELDVDFVLHGEGPASQWAEQAVVGGLAAIAGPGGRRYLVDPAATRLILAGDETALPALATILEALPGGMRANVYAEVQDAADEVSLTSAGQVHVTWLHRGQPSGATGDLLPQALQQLGSIDDQTRVWLACEASVMRRLRRQLLDESKVHPDAMVTRGYWKVGEVNYPDHDYGLD